MKNQPPSIIVVGAGIVGSSIAYQLASRGAQVRILDAAEPGQGASAVSFAWINARDKNPRPYHDLNRRSMDMWDRFARRLGGNIGLTWGGELRWAATEEGGKMLTERVKTLQSWGYPIHLLHPYQLNQIEPGLIPGLVSAASFSPEDMQVDTTKTIQACLDIAQRNGAVVSPSTKVTGLGLTQTSSRSTTIETIAINEEQIHCDVVVMAGGPDTPMLAKLAGIDLPVHHSFGATVITEPLPPILEQVAVIHTPSDQDPPIALRQFKDGAVMVHGGDGGSIGESLGKTEAEVNIILGAAAQYFPALKNARIKEVRRGRRPLPDDGKSILGFPHTVPNLYLAVTHSGVTLAPLIGEFAAIEILDDVSIDLLNPFRLERFI